MFTLIQITADQRAIIIALDSFEDLAHRHVERQAARDFLKKYDVSYIIVGQLERAAYKSEDFGNGLFKFEEFDGMYWDEVYRDGNTVIYEVKS